ncbi:hypothetical protein B0H14DRAFT_3568792 [Mycena olivaceomarginata]|nr:hypothetical protein B0H14DRAFT_3568792 [Mycena olivaceomarginata]
MPPASPLRIKLATRLSLGRLSDAIPPFQRHYEVARSRALRAHPCARAALDLNAIHAALTGVYGVSKAALRLRAADSAPEAFVAAHEVDTSDVATALVRVLPGYAVPSPIHVLAGRHTLLLTPLGELDYTGMELTVARAHASAMSEHALLPGSDLFLLDGNSLLLGKLAYQIRRQMGVATGVASLFTNSAIKGIAGLIEEEHRKSGGDVNKGMLDGTTLGHSARQSEATLNMGYDYEEDVGASQEKVRGQNHPVSMIVQALPFVFFYPLKTALTFADVGVGTVLLLMLSVLALHITGLFWERIASLMCAIVVTCLTARIITPVTSILFKWLVIGRYKPGTYRMSSTYHLCWWIVNQSLHAIFAMHPGSRSCTTRLLGAHDLLTFWDGCRIDMALVRGFAVEREEYFRLDKVVIGEKAVMNTFTQIAPGARIPNKAVYSPHASSRDSPSLHFFWLKLFVAWPVMFAVYFVSYIPWLFAVWLMVDQVSILTNQLNALEAVLILVKRLFGLNKGCATADTLQLSLLRRYINGHLLSKTALKAAFSILSTHYEVVSVAYRCMGAKIGKRVYWPGSGLYCLEPELLETGNDVVFGLCSEVFTTDQIGTGCVCVADGAMIVDRVVLLPGCKNIGMVGFLQCLDEGRSSKFDDLDTTTPFSRVFYRCKADYFIFPYAMIFFVNVMQQQPQRSRQPAHPHPHSAHPHSATHVDARRAEDVEDGDDVFVVEVAEELDAQTEHRVVEGGDALDGDAALGGGVDGGDDDDTIRAHIAEAQTIGTHRHINVFSRS